MPIAVRDGQWVTLGSVANIELTEGPSQINHREQQRTITIRMSPPPGLSTEAALRIIQKDILEPMIDSGAIAAPYSAGLAGSADSIERVADTLTVTFVLALIISFLLMAALFESFLYPIVIMTSIPLAAFGGILGLAILNAVGIYQPLDALTMLGFIILTGTVVNSAILIVHRSLQQMRERGMEPDEAILSAVQTRVRPMFLTVGTSSLAVLPLVLAPGAGAEVYRGMGAVIIAGLLVSTVFTLFLVPALMSLVTAGRSAFRNYTTARSNRLQAWQVRNQAGSVRTDLRGGQNRNVYPSLSTSSEPVERNSSSSFTRSWFRTKNISRPSRGIQCSLL
jgi:HAE1 family hydrophobic/amphiphilic exporter-1